MQTLVNAWKDAESEAIFLFEEDAAEQCESYVEGYVIQKEENHFIHEFYYDYFEAELAMVQKFGGVSIGPDYIAIYDDQGEELCYWDEQEWLDEPRLAINLANAVRIYYTRGPAYMRELLGK